MNKKQMATLLVAIGAIGGGGYVVERQIISGPVDTLTVVETIDSPTTDSLINKVLVQQQANKKELSGEIIDLEFRVTSRITTLEGEVVKLQNQPPPVVQLYEIRGDSLVPTPEPPSGWTWKIYKAFPESD